MEGEGPEVPQFIQSDHNSKISLALVLHKVLPRYKILFLRKVFPTITFKISCVSLDLAMSIEL